jgi:hypothetical protein
MLRTYNAQSSKTKLPTLLMSMLWGRGEGDFLLINKNQQKPMVADSVKQILIGQRSRRISLKVASGKWKLTSDNIIKHPTKRRLVKYRPGYLRTSKVHQKIKKKSLNFFKVQHHVSTRPVLRRTLSVFFRSCQHTTIEHRPSICSQP